MRREAKFIVLSVLILSMIGIFYSKNIYSRRGDNGEPIQESAVLPKLYMLGSNT
jgi:hypothetical protein